MTTHDILPTTDNLLHRCPELTFFQEALSKSEKLSISEIGDRHGHSYCRYGVLVVVFMRWQSSARALAVVAIMWRAVLGTQWA